MRIARFIPPGGGPARLGLVSSGAVVALDSPVDTAATWAMLLEAAVAGTLRHLCTSYLSEGDHYRLDEVVLLAPVARPGKFLAVGLNYAAHTAESGMSRPSAPIVFTKQGTSVSGPNDPIVRPLASSQVDYEGELGIVIGRRCRHVPAERARAVVAGYLIVNDVSVRDWQLATPTMTLGKSWDTHGPMGPWLTTLDEIDDPHDLRVQTWVNGELRQDGTTRDLLTGVDALVEYISTACTLEPGDVIATGTPAGVGHAMHPPRYLRHGDEVRIAISGLGEIRNNVLDEANDAPLIEPGPTPQSGPPATPGLAPATDQR